VSYSQFLTRLARDVLAIQVSTIASESAFSVGGRVIDPFRSSLDPEIVQALICTKDWTAASRKGGNVVGSILLRRTWRTWSRTSVPCCPWLMEQSKRQRQWNVLMRMALRQWMFEENVGQFNFQVTSNFKFPFQISVLLLHKWMRYVL
ncbi:Os06g0491800, partial [Oryza sativa Japonica Group]